MIKLTAYWPIGMLLLGAVLTGCAGESAEDLSETGSGGEAADAFDIDDVPSLNLPAEQRDPDKLWCREHSRYEDECYICHPELMPKAKAKIDLDDVPSLNLPADQRDPAKLWCREHSRYEVECYICHPELMPSEPQKPDRSEEGSGAHDGDDRQSNNVDGAALMCNEHGVLEIECGICQPDLLANLSVGEGMKIRFASRESTAKAGVSTSRPIAASGRAAVELLGEISFNRNQLARVTPLGSGIIAEVLRDVGETVTAGEVLAVVHSRDIAAARTEYIKALAQANLTHLALKRERELHQQEISARQDLEHAEAAAAIADAAVIESRQHLYNLGLSSAEIEQSSRERSDMSVLPVRAPFTGTIVERSAVVGTSVQPGDELFLVADLSTMWMQISISEAELPTVRVGTLVQARFDAYPGISFEGEVAWIAPALDSDTRMLQARVVLPNPQGLLKEGFFGRAALSGFAERNAVAVSAGAIQEIDGKAVVFRKLEDDLYETRLVTTGATHDGNVLVMAGLAPDDEIVTEGSYIVKSEFLKARLGAGCVDH